VLLGARQVHCKTTLDFLYTTADHKTVIVKGQWPTIAETEELRARTCS